MAAEGDDSALRTCFDWLMGPVNASSVDETILGCLKKRDLLKAGLAVVKGNLHLQRLYIEYNDQINSANEVCNIDKFLHV